MITSAQNPKLKLVRELMGRSKERRTSAAFVAEGVRLIEEAYDANWPVRFLFYSETLSGRGLDLVRKLAANGIEVEEVLPRLLESLSDTEASQGLLAVLEQSRLAAPESLNFVLIPDSLRDPGNLGTLLRSAGAAGVQAVFIPPETTDPFGPKVVRAGMGVHFRLPIIPASWVEIGNGITGLQPVLADMHGESLLWQADLKSPLALIIGGEAEGASLEARTLAAHRVFIPMVRGIESLNAGIAGSILLFEVVRQRSNF